MYEQLLHAINMTVKTVAEGLRSDRNILGDKEL
jgi:hypothetical protein